MSVQITTYERSTLVNDEKYMGLDVRQATIVVAVMDSTGKLVMESILETKAGNLSTYRNIAVTWHRRRAYGVKLTVRRSS